MGMHRDAEKTDERERLATLIRILDKSYAQVEIDFGLGTGNGRLLERKMTAVGPNNWFTANGFRGIRDAARTSKQYRNWAYLLDPPPNQPKVGERRGRKPRVQGEDVIPPELLEECSFYADFADDISDAPPYPRELQLVDQLEHAIGVELTSTITAAKHYLREALKFGDFPDPTAAENVMHTIKNSKRIRRNVSDSLRVMLYYKIVETAGARLRIGPAHRLIERWTVPFEGPRSSDWDNSDLSDGATAT